MFPQSDGKAKRYNQTPPPSSSAPGIASALRPWAIVPGAAAAATSAVSTLAAPTAAATSAFPGAATAAATAVQEQFDPGIRIGRRHGFRGGDNHKQGSLKSIGLKKSRGAGPKSLLRKGRIEE